MCTDSVDVRQNGNNQVGRNTLAIIQHFNFTCNGRITSIRARVYFDNNQNRIDYPFFQVWRLAVDSTTIYKKIGEVQLSNDQVTGSGDYQTANIILTDNNTIEVLSGDVVGYYHPSQSRYRVRTIRTIGYILYQFSGTHDSVDLSSSMSSTDQRQPLIQFTIGKFINEFKDCFVTLQYVAMYVAKHICRLILASAIKCQQGEMKDEIMINAICLMGVNFPLSTLT